MGRMDAWRGGWAALAVLACAAAAGGCAAREPRVTVLPPRGGPADERAAPAVPSPAARPDHTGNAVAGGADGAMIAQTAETMLGAPYRDGGALPDGFDCSGLVTWAFARHGVAVPRDVRRQAAAGVPVERGGILPGDLLFFATTGSGPTHVAIATDGGRFVHAPKSGAVVRVESLASAYWSSRLIAIRRLWGRAADFEI